MTSPIPWGAALRSVVASVEASDVRELEVRVEGLRIRLRRISGLVVAERPALQEEPSETSGLHLLRCPLTGIWYDAPSPGASPFVGLGDLVEAGSVVGLIESMKVFNEVSSDAAGVVREILAQRGELVAAHAPIMLIEQSAWDASFLPSDLG